ncbi:MAG: hypothetical protein SZ59_C0001G0044 [candidate division TM6 bacterium GW2011_GWF2_28_16]|nr:MAG: hypothetical protein SZ59_C0001G0044 [candidate division TM6 bacterium GW2011_GWF2_28_16]
MLSPRKIHSILLGPPVLTILILSGCWERGEESNNINNNNSKELTMKKCSTKKCPKCGCKKCKCK